MKSLTTPLLIDLDRALQSEADPAHRETIRHYFGSNVDRFYGVRMSVIRECSSSVLSGQVTSLQQRWEVCDELVATGIFEHKITAFHLATQAGREWTGTELPRFARWLHGSVDDWMDADDLCIRVLGAYFLRFPEQANVVDDWSRMSNPWSRRGSAVSLIPSARKGNQWDLVTQVCARLMNAPEPLVAKACGWLLKDASRAKPEEVREFVRSAGEKMSPMVRRIALKKLNKGSFPD